MGVQERSENSHVADVGDAKSIGAIQLSEERDLPSPKRRESKQTPNKESDIA